MAAYKVTCVRLSAPFYWGYPIDVSPTNPSLIVNGTNYIIFALMLTRGKVRFFGQADFLGAFFIPIQRPPCPAYLPSTSRWRDGRHVTMPLRVRLSS